MKKGVMIFLMAFFVSGIGPWAAKAATYEPIATGEYDYEIISQSDKQPVLKQGESKLIWVKLKNTGTENWQPDNWVIPLEDEKGADCMNDTADTTSADIKGGCVLPTPPNNEGVFRLGTIRPMDRNSGFMADYDWISTNRVNANFWEEVKPGQIITIGFTIQAPYDMVPGTYPEYFAPVIENVTWMTDKGLYWDVKVEGQESGWRAENWGYYETNFKLKAGQSAEVMYDLKNVGQETWRKNGTNPVHIGTIEPFDRFSQLYDPVSWISYNRPNGLTDESVAPGDVSMVKFSIKAPDKEPGTIISESFWLVAENLTWFEPGEYPYVSLDVKVEIMPDDYVMIDTANSTIAADKEKVLADGQDSTELAIQLINTDGRPAEGEQFWLSAFGCTKTGLGCWQVDDVRLTTDDNGMAYYTSTNEIESTVTYSYWGDDWYGYESLTIDFYLEGHENISFDQITTDKTEIRIDKNEVANIESYLLFDNNDPVANYSVEVIIEGGSGDNSWYYPTVWTDSDGLASYKISAVNYEAGDELTVHFRTYPLPPQDYSQYVESEKLTINVI